MSVGVPRGGPWWPRERLGLHRSARGMFLSVRDRGGCRKIQRGSAEGRQKKRKKKNLSEGGGKCIDDPDAAGLTGLHGHGWANGYYTTTCAKKKNWATLLCLAVKYVGAQTFCAMLLRSHPDGVDVVAWKHNVIAGGAPES